MGHLGFVTAVVQQPGGSALASPVAVGAVTLLVGDAADFEYTGGTLDIGPGVEQLPYVGVDDAAGTVALGQPTTQAYDEGTPVNIQPAAVQRLAYVHCDDLDGGDDLVARVPHGLYPLLREGIRAVTDQEPVVVDFDGSWWVVTNVVNVRPGLDTLPIDPGGALVVLDANGEITSQLSDLSIGFDELVVGRIISDSIVSASSGSGTLYVDPLLGDDDLDGLLPVYDAVSGSGPVQSIQSALDRITRYVAGDWVVSLKTGEYFEPVTMLGFLGSGSLTIDGTNRTLTTLYGTFDIEGCRLDMTITNMRIDDDGSGDPSGSVFARNSSDLTVLSCDLRANSLKTFAGRANASIVWFNDCTASGGTNAALGYTAGSMGRIQNCTGTGPAGIRSDWSIVFISGTQPAGGAVSQNSGQFFGTYNGTTGSGGTSGANKSRYWSPTLSGSWRNAFGGQWRSDSDYAYQGDYGYGNHRGCYFYDYADMRSVLGGKTIKAASIYLIRRAEGGISGGVGIYLGTHDLAGKSGSPATDAVGKVATMAWGKGGWFGPAQVRTLVSRIVNNTGAAKGTVAYQSDGEPYAVLNGKKESSSGRLKVTYA
jgi:hypothetical protein